MIEYYFETPMYLCGTTVRTLKEAARSLRQHSLGAGDYRSWELMRLLREVESMSEAERAEGKLRQWAESTPNSLQGTPSLQSSSHDADRRDEPPSLVSPLR